MKYLLTVLFSLCFVVAVGSDLPLFDITMEFAADATTADGLQADTTISDVMSIAYWEKMSFGYEIFNDTNFTGDSISLALQTAKRKGYDELGKAPTWKAVPGGSFSIAIGGNDTTNGVFLLIDSDSAFNYLRVLGIHNYTTSSSDTADLAGNSYSWKVRPWIDQKY